MSDSAQGLLPGTPPRRRPSIRDANTTQYSRSQASHSSGSLGVDDSPETSAQQSPSGSTSPTKQKRSSYRRKSSAATAESSSTPSASPPSGTFLTRFLGSFRQPTTSPPGARPSLPRSLSSPLQPSSSRELPQSVPALPGAFPASTAPAPSPTSSLSKRFRPGFSRRATTGTQGSSPRNSPTHSPALPGDGGPQPSPGSPATLRGKERDPMDFASLALGGGVTRSRTESPSGRLGRRGSAISQLTVLADPASYSPSAGAERLDPIAEPSTSPGAPSFEQPLELISTLLPAALLLMSQLGPAHLFSPPIQFPTLEGAFNPHRSWTSALEAAPVFSDRASVASSTTSTSSYPTLPNPAHITPSHSHELYAPSTLSVPAVSAAALWRLFRGVEWIGEVGSQVQGAPLRKNSMDSKIDSEEEPVFDFPSTLQGVADVLAAFAASRAVELVIGQVARTSSPSTTPPLEVSPEIVESRELLVRGDERAWTIALVWVVHQILSSAAPGATVEVRFEATLSPSTDAAPSNNAPVAGDSQRTFLPTRSSTQQWWSISLEFLHTFPTRDLSPYSSASPPTSLPVPPFDTPFARALFGRLPLTITAGDAGSDQQSWTLQTRLPGTPAKGSMDDPSTLLGRRRASLDGVAGSEPSMDDLKRFAEMALKGLRVSLHSGEQSTFAKHLTTYLAGWGMDVSHVSLDGDDYGGSNHGSETAWNRGRRDPLARLDSGFATEGNSPNPPFGADSSKAAAPEPASPSPSANGDNPPSNLTIIDDDVTTLRRFLQSFRPTAPFPFPHTSHSMKRPQLANRRARSSPHVRQLHQLPNINSSHILVHFASLTNYKMIKEIVQDALATSKSSLPEVLVIPKPAGPRRIITALWTALKRPAVDPTLPPIATSPTSPGIQYWTPRLSPAIAKEQEFDFANAEATKDAVPGSTKVRTPPAYLAGTPGLGMPTGHPPSPLRKISDNQVSYFSCVAETMDGTTPSEGMVIQSPDGRAAIFFQPQTRGARATKDKALSKPMERDSDLPEDGEDEASPLGSPPNIGPVATPSDIGLGHPRRSSASSLSPLHESIGSVSTPAQTLDSFILAAQSRGVDAEDESSNGGESIARQATAAAAAVAAARPPPSRTPTAASSPRVGSSSGSSAAQRRLTNSSQSTPPMSPAPGSPNLQATAGGAARPRGPSAPSSPPTFHTRRALSSSFKPRRKPSRKPSIAIVPPINVLIVEDNPINQTILSMFMKKKNIKYAVAKDGEEAVQKWKAGNFHLVLMDIQLPVKDGIEATREIREMERANNIGTFITTPTSDLGSPMSPGGGMPGTSSQLSSPASPLLSMPVIIVALTASSLQADRVNALAAGCNDFLTKPVSLPWLQQKLLEWGSMAYLSGFSQRSSDSDSSRPGSVALSTPNSARPAPPRTGSEFKAGFNKKADDVSAHLHIEPRSKSRSSSPARVTSNAAKARASPDDSPVPTPSPPSNPANPVLTVSSPTPVAPAIPLELDTSSKALDASPVEPASIAPQAGPEDGQAADLDAVDSKLESLVARRPGPSPLSATEDQPSLESVAAEGARLIQVGRSRASTSAADSFGQVMFGSGTVSYVGSAASSGGSGEDGSS